MGNNVRLWVLRHGPFRVRYQLFGIPLKSKCVKSNAIFCWRDTLWKSTVNHFNMANVTSYNNQSLVNCPQHYQLEACVRTCTGPEKYKDKMQEKKSNDKQFSQLGQLYYEVLLICTQHTSLILQEVEVERII